LLDLEENFSKNENNSTSIEVDKQKLSDLLRFTRDRHEQYYVSWRWSFLSSLFILFLGLVLALFSFTSFMLTLKLKTKLNNRILTDGVPPTGDA
jgi:hypothetical protein